MPKKKIENVKVSMAEAPHQIAIMIDDVVQETIAVPERLCAILLSDPKFAYFKGSTLPQDPQGRNIIGQTRIDLETNEWVHTDMDGSERREPLPKSPWEVEDNG